MPIINPDLTEITSNTIEPGTYQAEITNTTVTASKAGNPMIVVALNVQVGDRTFKRNSYLIITGKGAFQFEQLLRACGFGDIADAYKRKDGPRPDFDTDNLTGKIVMVQIEADTYNGNPSDKIQQFIQA